MKGSKIHGCAFIRVTILSLLWTLPVGGQVIESDMARIFIDNLPDTSPPQVRFISPPVIGDMVFKTNSETIDIIGEIKDESGIKFVTVDTEVRPVNETGIFTARIDLLPGENRIKMVAADQRDNLLEKTISVEYIPPVRTLADRITAEAKYYGLIIGIDHYEDPNLPDLDNPIGDAERLYSTLVQRYRFNLSEMVLLRDAKRLDIINALDYLSGRVTPRDNVLIFYAGHGTWDEKSDIGYWLPSDAYMTTTANWFRNSTLVDYLKAIDSKHTLLITDACFAGSIFKTRAGFQKEDRAYEVLYELPSRKAMTSGTLTEVPDRSSFTRYLIDRLDSNEDTYISSEQLFSSFRIAVINNSDAIPQYGEIRNVGDQGGDFIFLKRD